MQIHCWIMEILSRWRWQVTIKTMMHPFQPTVPKVGEVDEETTSVEMIEEGTSKSKEDSLAKYLIY